MKIHDIDSFFEEVAHRIDFPMTVILTGGAAGILAGIKRATFDIDFEIQIAKSVQTNKEWDDVQKALHEVEKITHITPHYSDDIGRWSAIGLPDKKSTLYKKIGSIEVRILEPSLWAIGKLTRFLSSDVTDLITVLKGSNIKAENCVRIWGRALGTSSPSAAQSTYRRQVEHFIDRYSETIWGKKINPEQLKTIFLSAAQKSRKKT